MEIACAYIEYSESTIESIAHVLEEFLEEFLEDGQCLWLDYDYIIESDRQIDWNATSVMSGFRQWSYQVCSQMGWFHTSASPDQPFGNLFPADVFHQACYDVFGESYVVFYL